MEPSYTHTNSFRRDVIHRMTRRCPRWDYRGTGAYLITLELRDRSTRALGRVVDGPPRMEPTPLGRAILEHALRLREFSPEIMVLGVQLMPDHLHMVLNVTKPLKKPLGEHLRGFKMGCTHIANAQNGLFAAGFVDTIFLGMF